MNADQFCHWLQGFAELNAGAPSEAQWESIRARLADTLKVPSPTRAYPTFAPNLIGPGVVGVAHAGLDLVG